MSDVQITQQPRHTSGVDQFCILSAHKQQLSPLSCIMIMQYIN